MKKFRYRLQTLLRVKEHIEREKQKEHAGALSQVHLQRQQLSQIGRSKEAALSDQRASMLEQLSVAEMLIYSRYLVKLKKDMLSGSELLKVLQQRAEKKRQALLEATKQKKIYEKLKERQQENFNRDVLRLETKENDEVAIRGHRRRH
ncbi:MAG: flagellar export protein FliJ [candidate division Zixibacteria bacterium]|nr:flagellar export protein FliJ [candidate division Zixibacteria bacterium]